MGPDPHLPDAVLRYADHADGLIDLHLARTPGVASPLVVLLHGGFWRSSYDRRHTRPMAAALAEAGFTVATPEYRRVGPDGGGGWPATGQDVLAAFRALPDLLAGLGVLTGPTVVTGHSAGGHLALWLASVAPEVAAVVALAPVCDLREASHRRLGNDAVAALFGSASPDPADPMLLYDEQPSATITVIHGVQDEDVPIELSRGLTTRHPWIDLIEVHCGHFEPIEPGSAAWQTVLATLEKALDPA